MIRSPRGLAEADRVSPLRRTADLLALSSPLLILLALMSMLNRSPATRLQGVPALLIGSGLLLFSWLRRRRRRALILRVLREPGAGKH
ncbi:MAG: DUF3188 domain-containing protein [Cyanobacteriota bacterium]|nr:DUF3188 domain-containing protein [Cyanobacteriota bacterium]